MRTSKHTADLRQLCCLGLGGQRIMPLLFDITQEIVPADLKVFFWADDKHELANLYCPELPQVADIAFLYATKFVNRSEPNFKATFSHTMKTERVVNWNKYENKEFFRSHFYNLIMRPLRVRHVLVGIADHKRRPGALAFMRRPGQVKFSPQEERTLASLIPYIAHGLTEEHTTDISYVENNRNGLLILNQKGKVQYACAQARELLFWATDPQFSQKHPKWPSSVSIPDEVIAICRNLKSIYQGVDAPPPAASRGNAWGLFTFRAYFLEQENHAKKALIGVTVEMQEPKQTRILSELRKFPLSPRQKEVSMMLLSGYRNREILQKLNLSQHTLIDYVYRIYDKIGVQSQAELFAKFGIPMADRNRWRSNH